MSIAPWMIYAFLAAILIGFIFYGFSKHPHMDIAVLLDRYGSEPAPAYETKEDLLVHTALISEYYAIMLDNTLVKRGASPPIRYKTDLAGWARHVK